MDEKEQENECEACSGTGNVLEPRKDSPGVDWEPCPNCYPQGWLDSIREARK